MFRPLGCALVFLTCLPLPARPARESDLGAALGYFPLVGLGLGGLLAAAEWSLRGHMPAAVTAVLLLALLAAITGGLHLDGLADVFDGLGGGRGDRDKTLSIMRDSRLGAHGAAALVLVLLAKAAALTELLARGDARVLVVFPLLSRWVVVPLVILFPYARAKGVGLAFHRHAGPVQLAIATPVAAVALAWLGTEWIGATIAAAAVAVGLALFLWRRLGGLTGDVYGAAIEATEVAFLVAAL